MRLSPAQRAALRAVAAGTVQHIHPFTFVVPIELLFTPSIQRTLRGLANKSLIEVAANAPQHQRPVRITERGR